MSLLTLCDFFKTLCLFKELWRITETAAETHPTVESAASSVTAETQSECVENEPMKIRDPYYFSFM